jgi:hypothetical protein
VWADGMAYHIGRLLDRACLEAVLSVVARDAEEHVLVVDALKRLAVGGHGDLAEEVCGGALADDVGGVQDAAWVGGAGAHVLAQLHA